VEVLAVSFSTKTAHIVTHQFLLSLIQLNRHPNKGNDVRKLQLLHHQMFSCDLSRTTFQYNTKAPLAYLSGQINT